MILRYALNSGKMFPIFRVNILIFTVIFTLTQSGCRKFVDVKVPPTQLISKTVFKDNNTATSAMLNVYQQMYGSTDSYMLELSTGLLSDELRNYSGNPANLQYYTNSMTATGSFGPWNNAYNYIYQANAVLEGLDNNPTVTPAAIRQLSGEAKFIRAFWYFYLANCYGDVPLAKATDYNVNKSLPRTPKDQIYTQIINDLKDAQQLLNENFVDASDTTLTTDRVRPTKWAATALLARSYLYTKDYQNAEIQATAVINNTQLFNLPADLDKVFLANSDEAIWQIAVVLPNYYNTPEGYNFILQGAPYTQAISDDLVNAFEPGDQRKDKWIGSYTTTEAPIITYYFPYKYKVFDAVDVTENIMMLRLAEQYLIRAEARAHGVGGGLSKAIDDLDTLRNRAGLDDYAGPLDESSVLAAILHERQVELFTEAHRWFDLIRTNSANTTMGAPGNVCQSKGGTWSPNWQLFPIAQSERNINKKLTQNTGY